MKLMLSIVISILLLATSCGPKPSDKNIDKPVDKSVDTPVGKVLEKPVEKPTDKPVGKSTTLPTAKPAERPIEKPIEKPVEKPADKTVTFDSLKGAGVGINVYSSSPPGAASPLPRSYPGAPPQIPHNITALTITATSNPCTGCHQTGVELSPGHKATKIPQSHYTDLTTGKTTENLIGTRYYCPFCHVPQSADAPPVSNK